MLPYPWRFCHCSGRCRYSSEVFFHRREDALCPADRRGSPKTLGSCTKLISCLISASVSDGNRLSDWGTDLEGHVTSPNKIRVLEINNLQLTLTRIISRVPVSKWTRGRGPFEALHILFQAGDSQAELILYWIKDMHRTYYVP